MRYGKYIILDLFWFWIQNKSRTEISRWIQNCSGSRTKISRWIQNCSGSRTFFPCWIQNSPEFIFFITVGVSVNNIKIINMNITQINTSPVDGKWFFIILVTLMFFVLGPGQMAVNVLDPEHSLWIQNLQVLGEIWKKYNKLSNFLNCPKYLEWFQKCLCFKPEWNFFMSSHF